MILHLHDEIQACGSFFNWHELLVTHQNTKILFNLISLYRLSGCYNEKF